jgi:tetratricopeptide (TPR) repeat protein
LRARAALLDGKPFHDYTVIGDYALWMRGNTLEFLNRNAEARAAYEQLAAQYPNSLRARDAILHVGQMEMNGGQAAPVPATLAKLVAKDDAAALLLTGKAQEQTGNPTGALASYRRLYFLCAGFDRSQRSRGGNCSSEIQHSLGQRRRRTGARRKTLCGEAIQRSVRCLHRRLVAIYQ